MGVRKQKRSNAFQKRKRRKQQRKQRKQMRHKRGKQINSDQSAMVPPPSKKPNSPQKQIQEQPQQRTPSAQTDGSKVQHSSSHGKSQIMFAIEQQECNPVLPGQRTMLNEFSDATNPSSVTGFVSALLQTLLGIEPPDQSVNQCVLIPHTGHNVLEVVTKIPQELYAQRLESSMPQIRQMKQPQSPSQSPQSRVRVANGNVHGSQMDGTCSIIATTNKLNEKQISYLQNNGKSQNDGSSSNGDCHEVCDTLLTMDDSSNNSKCYCWNEDDHISRISKFVTTTSSKSGNNDSQNSSTRMDQVPAGQHYLSTTCQADIKTVTLYEDVITNNMVTNEYTLYPKHIQQEEEEETASKIGANNRHHIDILLNHLQDNMEVQPRTHTLPPPPQQHGDDKHHSGSSHKHHSRHRHHKHDSSDDDHHQHHRNHDSHDRDNHPPRYHDRNLKGVYYYKSQNGPSSSSPQSQSQTDIHHDKLHDRYVQRLESYEIIRWTQAELMNIAPVIVTLVPDASDNSMSKLSIKAEIAHARGCDSRIARYTSHMPWCAGVTMQDFIPHTCTAESNKPCTLVLNNRWDYHLTVANSGSMKASFKIDVHDPHIDPHPHQHQQHPEQEQHHQQSGGHQIEVDHGTKAHDSDDMDGYEYHDRYSEGRRHKYYNDDDQHNDDAGAIIFHVALCILLIASLGFMFRWCYKRHHSSQGQRRRRRRSMSYPQAAYVLNNNNGSPENNNQNDSNDKNHVVVDTESMKPATTETNSSRLLQSSHVSSVGISHHQPLPLTTDDGNDTSSGRLKDSLLNPLKNIKNMLSHPKPNEYNVYEANPDFQYESMANENDQHPTDVLAVEPVSLTLAEGI